ncbi:MAG: EamA family transporter, partial [Pseudobdellovibrionaceae bacterium]
MKQHERFGLICLFILYFLWGSLFLANRLAVESIPPLIAALARHGIGGGSLILGLLLLRKWNIPTYIETRNAIFVGMIITGIASGTLTWAAVNVPSSYVAMAFTTMPLFMLMMNWISFERVTPSRFDLIALPLGLLGSGLMLTKGSSLSGGHIGVFDVILLIVCPSTWAFGGLLGRKLAMPKDIFVTSALQMVGGSILLAILSLLLGEWSSFSFAEITQRSLLGVAYIALGGSLVGYTAFAVALRNLDSRIVSTYAIVQPVIAIALGFFVGEQVGHPFVILGAVFAVTAVILT